MSWNENELFFYDRWINVDFSVKDDIGDRQGTLKKQNSDQKSRVNAKKSNKNIIMAALNSNKWGNKRTYIFLLWRMFPKSISSKNLCLQSPS